jgi:hypothetical protein
MWWMNSKHYFLKLMGYFCGRTYARKQSCHYKQRLRWEPNHYPNHQNGEGKGKITLTETGLDKRHSVYTRYNYLYNYLTAGGGGGIPSPEMTIAHVTGCSKNSEKVQESCYHYHYLHERKTSRQQPWLYQGEQIS